MVFLDVREPTSTSRAPSPNTVSLPEGPPRVPGRGQALRQVGPVVVYCAGGVAPHPRPRRCRTWATETSTLTGGFNRRKDDGRPWATPKTLTPAERNRYQRHLLLPEVGEKGQLKLLDSEVLLLGAGGLGRQPRSGPQPAWKRSA